MKIHGVSLYNHENIFKVTNFKKNDSGAGGGCKSTEYDRSALIVKMLH